MRSIEMAIIYHLFYTTSDYSTLIGFNRINIFYSLIGILYFVYSFYNDNLFSIEISTVVIWFDHLYNKLTDIGFTVTVLWFYLAF